MGRLEAISRLQEIHSEIKTQVVTSWEDEEKVLAVIQSRAQEYFPKTTHLTYLLEALCLPCNEGQSFGHETKLNERFYAYSYWFYGQL